MIVAIAAAAETAPRDILHETMETVVVNTAAAAAVNVTARAAADATTAAAGREAKVETDTENEIAVHSAAIVPQAAGPATRVAAAVRLVTALIAAAAAAVADDVQRRLEPHRVEPVSSGMTAAAEAVIDLAVTVMHNRTKTCRATIISSEMTENAGPVPSLRIITTTSSASRPKPLDHRHHPPPRQNEKIRRRLAPLPT